MSYQFANINDVKMHYDVRGSGPALLLIHAGIANLTMWEQQVPAFTQHFRVIRHDVRGFGETPNPAGRYTDYSDVKALFDLLGVSRANVLGISNGGRITMDFALTYPDMLDKLILVAPGLPGFKPPEDVFVKEMSAKYEEALKAGNKGLAAEIDAQVWVDGPRRKPQDVDPAFRQRAVALIHHTIELGIGEGEGSIARPPAAERLGEIKAQTMLIVGDEDLQSMHDIADEIEKGILHLRRVDMPGTAHLPPMEKPEQFNQIVLDFLGTP